MVWLGWNTKQKNSNYAFFWAFYLAKQISEVKITGPEVMVLQLILVGFQEDSGEYRLQLQLQNETINLWWDCSRWTFEKDLLSILVVLAPNVISFTIWYLIIKHRELRIYIVFKKGRHLLFWYCYCYSYYYVDSYEVLCDVNSNINNTSS